MLSAAETETNNMPLNNSASRYQYLEYNMQ